MHSIVKKAFKKVKTDRESQNLLANFGYLTLLQLAGYLFPLITLPYLSRTIGPDGFGKIAFASAVVMWFMSVVSWGFDYTATRDVARNRDNPKVVSEVFSNVFWTRCFLIICGFLILLLLIGLLPSFRNQGLCLIITFLMIPGHVMFPEWFFQALERMKYITYLSLLSKFIFTIAVFAFIHKPSDYILQPLFTSIGFFISGLISFYFILVRWGYWLVRPSLSMIIKTLKAGADVFINNFAPNLYNSFSYVLLGIMAGDTANGLLSAGDKAISITQQFMKVVSRTFFPFLSRHIDKHKTYSILSLSIAGMASILLFIFAPLFIRIFYTSEFSDAIILLRIMSFSILFVALTDVYGTNYLILEGHEKLLRNITICLSVVGLVIAFPFISSWGYYGAAITITTTRALLAIATMVAAMMVKKNHSS